jgi:L-ascorbate metabolism protein UlaG (beta-lactamase superfamily)
MTKIQLWFCAAVVSFTASCSRQDASFGRPTKNQRPGPPPQWVAPPPPAPSIVDAALGTGDSIATSKGLLQIIPIRHASIYFTFDHKHIYVDPAAEGNYDGLPKADFIFVTHSHPDHFDKPRIESMRAATTVLVGPQDVAAGISGVQAMNNGEKFAFSSFEVTAVPSYNLVRGPKPGERYHPKGKGNGYVFNFGGKRVYVSGDTECTPEMKALEHIDVAFVCMRLPYTMPPKEAAECIVSFKPGIVYPYHYQGSNLDELAAALASEKSVEVCLRDWYVK